MDHLPRPGTFPGDAPTCCAPCRGRPGDRRVHVLSGVPARVAAARRFVAAAIRLCPQAAAPDEVVDRAVLITSELATNTLRHTHSGDPGETFTVRVCTNTRGVHLADQLSTTRPARFWHCGQKSQRI